jgi:hypothetical protein
MNGQIFISYRREESRWSARSLYDRLCAHFDRKRIFIDIDAIALGEDFVKAIERTVSECDVLIAVIGARWLTSKDEHDVRRLDNPEDFVRKEIATALKREIRVIPVLMDGASMPQSTELPDDLKPLIRRNALQVTDTGFDSDCRRLAATIQQILDEADAGRRELEKQERRAGKPRLTEAKESLSWPPRPVEPSRTRGRRKLGPAFGIMTLLALGIGLAVMAILDFGPWHVATKPTTSSHKNTFQALTDTEIFVLGKDGSLWLQHGQFGGKVPASLRPVDRSVHAFQALSGAVVLVLNPEGNLWLEHGPFANFPPARQQVDGNVQAFQALFETEVVVLGTDGKLWFEQGPFGNKVPPPRQLVDRSVYAFQALSRTVFLVLKPEGNLWLEQRPFGNVPPTRQQIDGNVQAFQALSETEVVVLGTDGNLWLEHGPFRKAVPPPRQQVDRSVQAFQALSGTVFLVLNPEGDLWLEQRQFGNIPPTRQQVDGNVQAFQALSETKVVVLGRNGRLWLEYGPFGNAVPPPRQQINGSVALSPWQPPPT